jgi:uncharacterized protein YndB with AHSA1/START domain
MCGMTDIESTTDYQKTVQVNASPDTVFDALTTVSGLTAWWTRVTGSGDAGGELAFRFSHPEPCVMRVDRATRPTSVRWTVTACDFLPDWVGTHPTFTITPVDGGPTEVRLRHHGLTAELDCVDQCTNGWNHFTESLRRYAETGQGMPHGSAEDRARRA